jgi:hypothetical protein
MHTGYLLKSIGVIIDFLGRSIDESIEPIRIGRAGNALILSGSDGYLIEKALYYLGKWQLVDGGWSDPEETAWAASLISKVKGQEYPIVVKAIQWLISYRINGSGWGKHSRDQARIPTTALVLTLVPEAGSDEDYMWVAQEWAKDLSGSVQLSYKAGFYLLVAGHVSMQGDLELIGRSIKHLIDDQNDDGGFAPWKNHPIGSDPWSTGVVLWGLSKWIDRVDPAVIERALHWLEVTQLPSGYWPYHYLDEGTSYALIGAVSAMRAMASRK